jgi:heme-degrading monooxygenase HmoA
MIERHWSGVVQPGQADAYVRHLEAETFPQLRALPGFLRARILRREVPDGTEFRVVSAWSALDAIRAFAGDDVEAAVVPDVVQRMMVRFDARAAHYASVDGEP